jgi:hypothetical protein
MKVDIGCGPIKKEGFIGVDIFPFKNDKGEDLVDVVMDAGSQPWPWADESLDEVYANHFLEHLTGEQRIHFVNELYRCLKKPAMVDGKRIGFATIIVPHWASSRAYGDLTHQWPPVVEFWFYYLTKDWRKANAPHNDKYKCNFDATWFYTMHPYFHTKHQENQQFALSWYKEAAQDIIATLAKKVE